MVKSKKLLGLALILFIVSMALNFPFPHDSPYGETVASVLNIPVQSVDGLQYVGITSLLLLITSLFILTKSLKKYHGRFVLLAIIIAISGPPVIASSFQKTFATGIYAVSYDRDLSNCHFEMINEKTLHGKCALPFENYSRNDVQFAIQFYEKYYFEDDVPIVSLMNNNVPYEVKLKGHERKNVKVETNIDVSNIENHIDNGELTIVHIIIKSGGKIRKL